MEKGFHSLVLVLTMVAASMLHGSVAQTTHVVGGSTGWTVPSGGAAAYATWAASQTFRVGDTLVFNFTTGTHTAAEVTKAAFDSCSTASPISVSSTGPASIVLQSAGDHYYLCTFPGHCDAGQKLSIKISGGSSSTTSPAPQPSAASPAPVAGEPAKAPAPTPSGTYIVGDSLGWTVPRSAAIYQTWARGKTFRVGDVLVFNFASGRHNVAKVTKTDYESCNTSSPLVTITTTPARIILNTTGEHYYLCTFPGHCSLGQKLAVNVTGSGIATPPSSIATPPSSSASGPTGETNPTSPPLASTPGNSAAPSLSAAFLPITFLSSTALLALFY